MMKSSLKNQLFERITRQNRFIPVYMIRNHQITRKKMIHQSYAIIISLPKISPVVIRSSKFDYSFDYQLFIFLFDREVNEIRSRLPTKPTEAKKSSLDDNQPAVTKSKQTKLEIFLYWIYYFRLDSGSSTLYVGIALFVAIIVFFGYLWLEK